MKFEPLSGATVLVAERRSRPRPRCRRIHRNRVRRFGFGDGLTPDGLVGEAEFTTRVLVRRPPTAPRSTAAPWWWSG